MKRSQLSREVTKILRAQKNNKRGPFKLAGGVQVHLWEDWILVTEESHQFADRDCSPSIWKEWSKSEFEDVFKTHLSSRTDLSEAPFWIAFSPDQNARNVLVAAGKDLSWPTLTKKSDFAVISAFKLLKRWRDANLRLRMSLLW